jgi:hypothetical protein
LALAHPNLVPILNRVRNDALAVLRTPPGDEHGMGLSIGRLSIALEELRCVMPRGDIQAAGQPEARKTEPTFIEAEDANDPPKEKSMSRGKSGARELAEREAKRFKWVRQQVEAAEAAKESIDDAWWKRAHAALKQFDHTLLKGKKRGNSEGTITAENLKKWYESPRTQKKNLARTKDLAS